MCELGDIISVDGGRLHTVVATDKGVFATGSSTLGQCGFGDRQLLQATFRRVTALDAIPITSLVCGLDHTVFLTQHGRLLSCGWGADGQTGIGASTDALVPVAVDGDLKDQRIVAVRSGSPWS